MEDLLMALGRIPMIHATLAHYPTRRSMVSLLFLFFLIAQRLLINLFR